MRDFLRKRYDGGIGSKHIWCGVTVENNAALVRVHHLRAAPAGLRFLSVEPLISPVSALDVSDINWVIVGGESGPGSRPMSPDWAREVRDKCLARGVAFFFKQWGAFGP